jgi:hypothetical protein
MYTGENGSLRETESWNRNLAFGIIFGIGKSNQEIQDASRNFMFNDLFKGTQE